MGIHMKTNHNYLFFLLWSKVLVCIVRHILLLHSIDYPWFFPVPILSPIYQELSHHNPQMLRHNLVNISKYTIFPRISVYIMYHYSPICSTHYAINQLSSTNTYIPVYRSITQYFSSISQYNPRFSNHLQDTLW